MSTNGKSPHTRVTFNRQNYFQFLNEADGVIKPFDENPAAMKSYAKDVPWHERKVNIPTAQKFLKTLFPGKRQWQTFDEATPKKQPQRPARTYFGTLEEFQSKIVYQSLLGCCVSFAFNKMDGKGQSKENVTEVQALVGDLDGEPLLNIIKMGLIPHAIHETSPNRYQVFWCSKLPRGQFQRYQDALAQLIGSDPQVEINKRMRVPGFLNSKVERDKIYRSRLRYLREGEPYSLEEIQQALPLPKVKKKSRHKSSRPVSKANGAFSGSPLAPNQEKIPQGQRGKYLTKRAGQLLHKGLSVSEVMVILRHEGKHKCSPPLQEADYVNLEHSVAKWYDKKQPQKKEDTRPNFIWAKHLATDLMEFAEKILQGLTEDRVYQRGDQVGIVKPVYTKRGKVYKFVPVSDIELARRLTQQIKVKVIINDDGDKEEIPFPRLVAQLLLDPAHHHHLPVLNAIVTHPTLRHDGTILNQPGYDAATGIFVVKPKKRYHIPESPTRKDARRALKKIREVYSDFPFAGRKHGSTRKTPDESVILALNMSALTHATIDQHPFYISSAPERRTGKDKLLQGAAILCYGHQMASTSFTKNPEENDKRIFSALRRAAPIFYLENVPNGLAVESDTYCSIITGLSHEERVLKEHRDEEHPTNMVIMASGNNIQVRGELDVRTLQCYIDSKMPHPEERDFFKIPAWLEYVEKHYPELTSYHLTILVAYHLACLKDPTLIKDPGRTGQDLKPWGGFEDYDKIIRRALIWAGMPDPCEARWREDSKKEEGETFAHEFASAYQGNEEFKLSQVCQELNEGQHGKLMEALPPYIKDRQGKVLLHSLIYLMRRLNRAPLGDWAVAKLTKKHGGTWAAGLYADIDKWAPTFPEGKPRISKK
jgi:hypothetical protein